MDFSIADIWITNLESSSNISLQQQLHTLIRQAILEGKIKGNTRLPSSRDLAKRLGVGRNTVINAYEQLIAEGYLETRKGAGTFTMMLPPDQLLSVENKPTLTNRSYTSDTHKTVPSGISALDIFPHKTWAKMASKAWLKDGPNIHHSNDPMGYMPLRKNIADYLIASRNVQCSAEQIIIVSGLQQGLFLLANTLIENGKSIFLEDPGYSGLHTSASASRKPISYVNIDEHGAIPPEAGSGLLVTCPSRQYPFGYTMPHARRLELLSWASETNSLILEDDYDSEFRYAGRPLNSLQGIDGGNRVIYGGTFSKTIFPTFRLGYLVLPTPYIEPVRAFRSAIDSFPSITPQLALSAFMESGDFAKHIRRLRKTHAARHEAFQTSFKRRLHKYFTLTPSDAGLHMLATPTTLLQRHTSTDDMWANLGQKAEVAAVPLSQTFRKAAPQQGLLLGFAETSEDQIDKKLHKFSMYMLEETHF